MLPLKGSLLKMKIWNKKRNKAEQPQSPLIVILPNISFCAPHTEKKVKRIWNNCGWLNDERIFIFRFELFLFRILWNDPKNVKKKKKYIVSVWSHDSKHVNN